MKSPDQRMSQSSMRVTLLLGMLGVCLYLSASISQAQAVDSTGLLSSVQQWVSSGHAAELEGIPPAELSIGQRYDAYDFSDAYLDGQLGLTVSEAFVSDERSGYAWIMRGTDHKALVEYADYSHNQTDLRVTGVIGDGVPDRILTQYQTGDWIVDEVQGGHYLVRGSQIIPISNGGLERFPLGTVTLLALQHSTISRLDSLNWDISQGPPASQTLMAGFVVSANQSATAEAQASTQTPTHTPEPQVQLPEDANQTAEDTKSVGTGTVTLVSGTLSLLLMLGVGLAVRARRAGR